ncbi:hypothetical protein [Helicobacter pullorum]|uniref:hypothetical protein n=1 Tax=Helicobacter pullorum TaxID=35818 RepID=UPI001478C984|nr:hypothetical protein [Helicobacter pullorum]
MSYKYEVYGGFILDIFSNFEADLQTLETLCDLFNETIWQELGFVCDGWYLFS